jgi:hypothetical protein
MALIRLGGIWLMFIAGVDGDPPREKQHETFHCEKVYQDTVMVKAGTAPPESVRRSLQRSKIAFQIPKGRICIAEIL